VVDATVTLLRRLAHRERIWEAHKTHFYQRLVQLGWGHRRTVTREYALMGACALSAVAALALSVPAQWLLLSAWLLLYAVLIREVGRIESTHARKD
jgi:hypothetical protein